jgi:hypothetical protein
MRFWIALVAMLPVAVPMAHAQAAEMQGMAMGGPHITMTPHWQERPGDRARADSVVLIARAALERYRDVAVAEADGFKRFAPQAKHQRVYHYTSVAAALKARFTFDPASPTALLYQENGGGLHLVGVMYTMPPDARLEDLDRRIPLSVASWHQHTNICLPPRGNNESEAAVGRHSEFGPQGAIATADACAAAGGRWFPRLFGWMVHVNLFASTPDGVWADEPGGMRHH